MNVKRVVDAAGATALLLLMAALLLVVAAATRARLGSPMLFPQIRPGRDGQPFTLYKFRTMTDEYGSDGK